MLKNIIKIDENKCVGCSLCVSACKEGAIGLIDGKARLLREDYCDGLGNCLPVCPIGAISFEAQTHLNQWPVQIRIVPPNAPYFDNAELLIAADCVAYAYNNFHDEYMRNKVTIIGCPKLDEVDYSEKLKTILMQNDIKSIAVARMEVPCCGGIENAVKTALQNCEKMIPCRVVTISINGDVLSEV